MHKIEYIVFSLTTNGVVCYGSSVIYYTVYIIRCGDGTLYTGITNDLKARIWRHRQGKAAKYTRGRQPLRLVYKESTTSKSSALRREAMIKRSNRLQKLSLIRKSI